jgi:hypothetical protein
VTLPSWFWGDGIKLIKFNTGEPAQRKSDLLFLHKYSRTKGYGAEIYSKIDIYGSVEI